MNLIRLTEIITEEEIKKWKQGNKVLISAQTGTGKSEIIKTNLYNICKKEGKRILLFTNRTALKSQTENDLLSKTDIISVHNYQEFEAKIIIDSKTIYDLFKNYDYIVYDEAHYIFSDSSFNRNTDELMKPLVETDLFEDKILLFMTATPFIINQFYRDFDFTYDYPKDFSYIKNIYYYNKLETLKIIIDNVPINEKIIYFGAKAIPTWELSNEFINADFFCSENNHMYKYCNKQIRKEISINSKFNCRILFTTKVLDNGINIIDDKLKHIIIDMSDPISFMQCLGRRRVIIGLDDDYINLYFRNYHNGNIYAYNESIDKKLAFVREFEELPLDDFKRKHRKETLDPVLDNDYRLNLARLENYKFQSKIFKYLLTKNRETDKPDPMSYIKFISKLLDTDNQILNAENSFEKFLLIDYLETMVDIKLYKEQQLEFTKFFFDKIFSPKKTNYRHRGVGSIDAIMREDNLPYRMDEGNDGIENGRKRYWKVIRR